MPTFAYLAPATTEEALAVLAEHRDDAKVLAGGQSLVPLLNYRLARPRVVVDINGLPLDGLSVAMGTLRLGALPRHAALEEAPQLAPSRPLPPGAPPPLRHLPAPTPGALRRSPTPP